MSEPGLPELRASDADREHAAETLRHAAGEGRLTLDELDERLNAAYAARTRAELERLVTDVVVPGAEPAPRMPVRPGDDAEQWLVAIMSGCDREGRWRLAQRVTALNIMGGSDLDLNAAELAGERVVMTNPTPAARRCASG